MKAVKITADSIPHILKVTQRYTEDVLNCFAFDADLCPCEYYYIAYIRDGSFFWPGKGRIQETIRTYIDFEEVIRFTEEPQDPYLTACEYR